MHDVGFARSRANFETNLLTDDDDDVCTYVCMYKRATCLQINETFSCRYDNSWFRKVYKITRIKG